MGLSGLCLFGLCLSAPAPAAGQEARQVYLAEARREAPALEEELHALRAELPADPGQAAARLDALLLQASRPRRGDLLVALPSAGPPADGAPADEAPLDGLRYASVAAEALRLVRGAPRSVRQALAALHDKGARLALASDRPPAPRRLLRRYPLAGAAVRAAGRLMTRAVERGDLAGWRSLDAWLVALHPVAAARPAQQAQRARVLALAGQPAAARAELTQLRRAAQQDASVEPLAEATATALAALAESREPTPQPALPGARARLEEIDQRLLGGARDSERGDYSPCYPLRAGEGIAVSNGGRLELFGPRGEPRGALPQDPDVAALPPPVSTSFQGRIALAGGIGFTPLVLERWLTPARDAHGAREAALAGRYYSLVAFDLRDARLRWWDGDPGPLGDDAPTLGWGQAAPELLNTLSRAHVLACAADAARVYVAFTLKAEDPELQLCAFERRPLPTQALGLVPAWPRATFLLAAERRDLASAEDGAVVPELAATLELDAEGRLFLSSDVGVSACLDAAGGDLVWVRHDPRRGPPARPHPFRRLRKRPERPPAPPEPVRLVSHPEEGALALVRAAEQWVAVRAADGRPVWSAQRRETTRLALVEDVLVAYGGSSIVALDLEGRELRSLSGHGTCVGELARIGSCLVFPIRDSSRVYRMVRKDLVRSESGVRFFSRGLWELERARAPANLLAVPGGIVAATRRRVLFYRWVE